MPDTKNNEVVPFTLYLPSGQIRVMGSAPADQVRAQMREGDLIIYEASDPANQYVEGRKIVDIPPRPSKHHTFDYIAKKWTDPRTLQDLKDAKWQEIKLARAAAEFGGFEWDGSRFDSDAISQSRIQGAVQLAPMTSGFFIDWTLADNTVRALSAKDVAALGSALGAHVAIQHAKARGLRVQIEAATSAEQLENITWEAE